MLRAILVMTVLATQVQSASAARPERVRKWTDDTGTFQVKATLAEISESGDSVKLRLEDGKYATVPLERLSDSDRRYVASRSRRKLATGRDPDSAKSAASSKKQPETRLFGIDWHTSVEQARDSARGTASPRDDKPVMCFRVLGELDGFM
ncbi:MAG: SHD1 domain-containing protein [Planctomycetota bacterium]|jgi:hypothetical protein